MIKVLDHFGEKVPGEARWQTTCQLVCTRVFVQ
jgi:hypothetical protein